MDERSRREFLVLLAAAAATPALASRAGAAPAAKLPAGVPEVSGGPVFEKKDSGAYVVYEAGSLAPTQAGSHRFDLPEKCAPASITKTFCADAALRSLLLGAEETLFCDGDGFRPEGHGAIAVVEALATSCNTFFEKVGARLSWEQFRESCRRLGGMDACLPEKPVSLLGRIDTYAHGTGIEAGFENLARLARAVAFAEPGDVALAVIRRGWRRAVPNGTARASDVPDLEVAGKTGTLPPPTEERKFTAFAPMAAPRWIVVTRTGPDGASAAEIAGRVFLRLRSLG
jgi:hypothetical protein